MARKKITDAKEMPAEETVRNVDLSEIMPSPLNRRVTDDSVASLALSLSEQGLTQPIILRPVAGGLEIVAGERRWRAAKTLGWDTIPAIVRDLDDDQAHAARLVENLQREDVPPLEQSAGVDYLLKKFGGNAEEVAKQLGVSESWVRVRAQLNNLSDSWREELADPGTPYEKLRDHVTWQEQLAKLPRAAQDALAKNKALKYCHSLESLKRAIGEHLRELSDRPWPDDEEKRMARKLGSCAKCQHRSDRAEDLFSDLLPADDDGARCLDETCWERKKLDWLRHVFTELKREHPDAVVVGDYSSRETAEGISCQPGSVVNFYDVEEPENADETELEENERLVWALLVCDGETGRVAQVIVTDEEEDAGEIELNDAERAERERVEAERRQAYERRERRATAFCGRVQGMTPNDLRGVEDGTAAALEVVRLAAMVVDHEMTAEAALGADWQTLALGLWEMVRDQLQDIAAEEVYDPSGRLDELAQVCGIELPE